MAYIMPLVINGLRVDTQTHTCTHRHTYRHANENDFKKLGTHNQRPCVPGLTMRVSALLLKQFRYSKILAPIV